MLLTIIVFATALLILVVSHEFGHFILAKKFGVKVLEFGFGIPPKIWGKKWGGTLVSLNLLPVGGFVRLFGEDETDKEVLNDERSFAAKAVWQRIIIVAAGVGMNLLLAVVLFYIILAAQNFKAKIPLYIPYQFAGVTQTNQSTVVIGGVNAGSPAEQAGIKQGDLVVSVNGQKIENSEQLIGITKQNVGEKVRLELTDEQENRRTVELTPRKDPPKDQGPLGIQMGTVTVANLAYNTLPQKLASGIVHSYNLTAYSLNVLGSFIAAAFETKDFKPVSGSVVGPVGLVSLTGEILKSESPLIPYLSFVALLSLNLAIVNILPIPALDGGRIFFLLIEAAIGRRVKPSVEKIIHAVGMVLLIALIILVTFSDIRKFFF